jgi:hypothetical protein
MLTHMHGQDADSLTSLISCGLHMPHASLVPAVPALWRAAWKGVSLLPCNGCGNHQGGPPELAALAVSTVQDPACCRPWSHVCQRVHRLSPVMNSCTAVCMHGHQEAESGDDRVRF